MFLMAFHRAVAGWLGVIHLDEAGKGLQVVGAEREAGEGSRSSAPRRCATTPAGGSETPIAVSCRPSSSRSAMVVAGCGWGRGRPWPCPAAALPRRALVGGARREKGTGSEDHGAASLSARV